MEAAIEPTKILQPEITNQPFGREITTGRVVLMQGVDRDAVARRAGGVRQRFPKLIVPLVGDADPVHRAQDDRLAGAKDHDAPATER